MRSVPKIKLTEGRHEGVLTIYFKKKIKTKFH